jgi:pimeloyl-ACP methyl ester carboxylesterase
LNYDRWGSGDSEPLEPPFSRRYLLDEALHALPEVLRVLRIDRPILVGHSDGATIALAYAGACPQAVCGVVAIAPHLFREERTLAAIGLQIADFERGDLKERLARYHGAKTESLFRRLVEVWTAGDTCAWGVEPLLRQVSCPVLVIQGTEDEFFSPAQVEAISAMVPRPVETLFVPGCGHAPHQQEPKLVHAAAAEFLRRLLPDPGTLLSSERRPAMPAGGRAG